MGCDSWLTKLDAFVDGELPGEEMRAFDAHLRGCASCAAEALGRVQLKRALKNAGARFTPNSEFRKLVREKIAAEPRRSWNFGWALGAAALALLLVASLTGLYLARQQTQRQLYSELTDLHVAALASAAPVDVVSTDRHTVKPWFEGKIPFTFNLPDLQNTDFTLVGGRVTYLGQVPGAHLIYRIRKHQISVFIFPEESLRKGVASGAPAERPASFQADGWTQDGLRYFVVGDVSAEDMRSLSNLLKSARRS